MDRRTLRRIAVVSGALAVIGGAVVVLRVPEPAQIEEPAPPPVQQTSVAAFADDAVVVPDHGPQPDPPLGLDIRAGDHRLLVGWGQAGAPEPEGVAGYEVRWGEIGSSNRRGRLVARPGLQLDGLRNNIRYSVSVRAVDSFGQRSRPARAAATPAPGPADSTPYTFADRFDGVTIPNPAHWRLVGIGNCTKASRGDGEDARRMVVTGQCGNSDEAVALRSRTPLRLRDPASAPDGELGRFIVQTDRPGQSGDLMLDLVPGPVDLIGRPPSQNAAPGEPGRAAVDESLPPGTIRVRISGQPDENRVRVLVAPGTATLGRTIAVTPPPPPGIWISARWEVVLRTDGVLVLRDGVVVGGGDVVAPFTEATALIGLTGGSAGLRAAFDLIGFTGAPTATPPLVDGPGVDFDRAVAEPSSRPQTSPAGEALGGVLAGQLRITLVPQRQQDSPTAFAVDIGGRLIPARPAVPGQPVRAGVRLPVVADVPPGALVLGPNATAIPVVVHATASEDGQPTQVLTAELELTGDGSATPVTRAPSRPLPRVKPALATPAAVLLDAAGAPVPLLQEMPRGRLVLEVSMDGAAAQRATGEVAGLAGVEISMDGRPLAGIPTVAEGPGIGGRWRIALNTTEFTPGGHTVQVTAIGVDPNTSFAISYASFVVR